MMSSSLDKFKIVHSTYEDRFISAVSSTEDVLIKYPIKFVIKKHQVNTFNNKGIPYYDIPVKYSESDIISNIRVNYENNVYRHKIQLVVNGNIQEVSREIYICALLFTKIEIRIYFSDIICIPDNFNVEYDGYIFSNIEDRRYFQRNPFQTDSHTYDNGIFRIKDS